MRKNKETKVFWSIFDCFSAGKQCRWPLSIQGRGLDFQLLCNCNWKKNQNREPWQVLHHMMTHYMVTRVFHNLYVTLLWLACYQCNQSMNHFCRITTNSTASQPASCNQRQSQHSILRWEEDHCRMTSWWQSSQQWHSSDLLWDLVLFRFIN